MRNIESDSEQNPQKEKDPRERLYAEEIALLQGETSDDLFQSYIDEVWGGRLIEGETYEIKERLKSFSEHRPEFITQRISEITKQIENLRSLKEREVIDDNLHREAHHILANEVHFLRLFLSDPEAYKSRR